MRTRAVRIPACVTEIDEVLVRGQIDQRACDGETPKPESNIAMGRCAADDIDVSLDQRRATPKRARLSALP